MRRRYEKCDALNDVTYTHTSHTPSLFYCLPLPSADSCFSLDQPVHTDTVTRATHTDVQHSLVSTMLPNVGHPTRKTGFFSYSVVVLFSSSFFFLLSPRAIHAMENNSFSAAAFIVKFMTIRVKCDRGVVSVVVAGTRGLHCSGPPGMIERVQDCESEHQPSSSECQPNERDCSVRGNLQSPFGH